MNKLRYKIRLLASSVIVSPIIIMPIINKNHNSYISNTILKENKKNKYDFLSLEESWTNKVSVPTNPVSFPMWNGENCNSLDDMANYLITELKCWPKKPIQIMSPYDIGEFCLNFYLNNGGARATFNLAYKGKKQAISVDGNFLAKETISSLDGPPSITKTTTRFSGSVLAGLKVLLGKMGQSGDLPHEIGVLLSIFGRYGKIVFGTDNILEIISHINDNVVLRNVVELMAILPPKTITYFPLFFNIFQQICQKLETSTVALAWANDHGITSEFKNFDKFLIAKIVHWIN